ncbi:MAG: 4-(cytidine 5'-diphospho)-2-C-methyl-D-erythritol kinase [Pseudomonadales bacterium]|nr:4-(cytidine 5'-diphospho)-2-C-methyl-D-erythritol kinase [Pseudomonadales bacterium]
MNTTNHKPIHLAAASNPTTLAPDNILHLPAPAKLNLFLHITGRRADGYHNLQTLFQLLDYGDLVTLEATTTPEITMKTKLSGLADEDNIAWRAAKLLQEHAHITRGAIISIEKNLPMGGGLGGGSSNAASTLLGLNKLWGLNLPLNELASLGLTLGADVPVFVQGQNSLAEGVGEQLYPIDLPDCWYLVVQPHVNISTQAIFSHPQLTRDTLPIRIAAFFRTAQRSISLNELLRANRADAADMHNDCEALIRSNYVQIDEALKWLGQFGKPALTGTGSCIFAKFTDEAGAQAVLRDLPDTLTGFVSRASQVSTAHKALRL